MANLFSKVLGTDKEGLQTKQGDLQNKISELATKVAQVKSALSIAEANVLVDETATNKKQVEKLQKGIEKFEADMSKAGEQLAEVQAKLQEIAQEERQALLLDLAKQDAESKEQSLRENRLRNHLDILRDSLSSGGVGRSLLERELGITHTGNPNVDVTWHDFPVELAMQREAQAEVQDRVDTEFEQLVQAINKYLGC